MAIDENALICDFVETYHVFDIYALPVETAATLAAGLRENARVIIKAGGAKTSPLMILLAHILDALRLLVWSKTKDAERGINRPESVAENFMTREKKNDIVGFSSSAEFEKERARLVEAARNGN